MSLDNVDFSNIRTALSSLPSDHDADGEHKPSPDEIFAPEQHATALDPYTSVVVGARGAGKSFWAGVLNDDDNRAVAAQFYPHLGLNSLIVASGYSTPSQKRVLDALVPSGEENELAYLFWQSAIIKYAVEKMNPDAAPKKLASYMKKYADPEDAELYLIKLDKQLEKSNKVLLITFDALDTIAKDWNRATLILDALFEVVWSLRVRKFIKPKVFIRPEQLNDESLRFVEMPKLRSSRVELHWSQSELYGLLFSRLAFEAKSKDFLRLCSLIGYPAVINNFKKRVVWPLMHDKSAQKVLMTCIAGPYMGNNYKKGGTYDWPYKHLSDANGEVTPRSFVKLFVEASKHSSSELKQVISAEGIRHGLREASKVRVDQLVIEYRWIRRALAPLAGLRVPCEPSEVYERWKDTNTIKVIMDAAADKNSGFLPPFSTFIRSNRSAALLEAMTKIGVVEYRQDGRIDIPDLFRVAALMLKKGGLPPIRK